MQDERRSKPRQLLHIVKLRLFHRLYRQSSVADQLHIQKFIVGLNLGRDSGCSTSSTFDTNSTSTMYQRGFSGSDLASKYVCPFESVVVGIGLLQTRGYAHNPRGLGIRVIVEDFVAHLHLTHIVARLVLPYPPNTLSRPARGLQLSRRGVRISSASIALPSMHSASRSW